MAINMVTEAMKQDLLSLKKEDLDVNLITKLFGFHTEKDTDGRFVIIPPKYKQNMPMILRAGEYINKAEVNTNIGIFLFNKLLIENRFEKIIPNGYVNEVVTKKVFESILDKASVALMKGEIHIIPEVSGFLKDFEFYGLKLVTIFSPSYSLNLIKPQKSVEDEKNKLMKDEPPVTVQQMTKLENTLVESSRKLMDKESGMTMYKSGARGSFENDYKNMTVSIGPVENPGTGKFSFVESNYINGLQKKDLVSAGNMVVNSEYPKAVGTQVGGYLTKQFYAVYQNIVVDNSGTDCGTHECIEIYLTENNYDDYLYQYIQLPSMKLVELNEDNYKSFINKKVKIRSPMYCLNDKICTKCAGIRFAKLGIDNVGLTAGKISNNFLNLSLKKKHVMKVTLDEVDPTKLLI